MKKDKRFEIVYQEGGFMGAKTIYVDKETGVNYLFIVSGYAGGLTPLLDAEGKAGHHKRDCRLIKPRSLSGAKSCFVMAEKRPARPEWPRRSLLYRYRSALSRW